MLPEEFFKSKEETLSSLLIFENKQFIVPDYQRKYAWTISETNQLWLDFLKTVSECFSTDFKQELSNTEPHFFGAIVLTQTTEGKLEITDGQQRLTTSIIFSKILYELANKLQNSVARTGIQTKLHPLFEKSQYGDAYEARLCLDDSIDPFFKEYILKSSSKSQRDEYLALHPISRNSSKQNLVDAYNFLYEKLNNEFPDNMDDSDLENKLLCYTNTLNRYFMLLKILVYKKETAYTIFETLNKRGKDLSESDMIKNELFKSANPNERDTIKELWDRISETLDTEDLTEYIRFQYSSKISNVTPAKLFEEIKKYISSTNSLTYLNTLVSEVDWFAKITLCDTTNIDSNLKSLLYSFKSLDVTHCYPLLLSAAICYKNDINTLKKVVKGTLTFCFRYFTIGKATVANLENEIGNLSRLLRKINNINPSYQTPEKYATITSVDTMLEYMHSLTSDLTFIKKFTEFATSSNSLAFYIIYNLECSLKSGVVPLPHSPNQHIEHIMPKTPSKARNRQNEWYHVRNLPEYKDYTIRLGNMIILESDINLKVKNKDYSYKKSEYSSSGLFYPDYISRTFPLWDFSTIENRQAQMAQTALSIWNY